MFNSCCLICTWHLQWLVRKIPCYINLCFSMVTKLLSLYVENMLKICKRTAEYVHRKNVQIDLIKTFSPGIYFSTFYFYLFYICVLYYFCILYAHYFFLIFELFFLILFNDIYSQIFAFCSYYFSHFQLSFLYILIIFLLLRFVFLSLL